MRQRLAGRLTCPLALPRLRLQLACEQLRQGCSVQQAAHFVGYRHATNFATAFRARYGIAPSELR